MDNKYKLGDVLVTSNFIGVVTNITLQKSVRNKGSGYNNTEEFTSITYALNGSAGFPEESIKGKLAVKVE